MALAGFYIANYVPTDQMAQNFQKWIVQWANNQESK